MLCDFSFISSRVSVSACLSGYLCLSLIANEDNNEVDTPLSGTSFEPGTVATDTFTSTIAAVVRVDSFCTLMEWDIVIDCHGTARKP